MTVAGIEFKENAIIRKIIEIIIREIDPDKIILFGSRATGNSNKDSDYDIFSIDDDFKEALDLAEYVYNWAKDQIRMV